MQSKKRLIEVTLMLKMYAHWLQDVYYSWITSNLERDIEIPWYWANLKSVGPIHIRCSSDRTRFHSKWLALELKLGHLIICGGLKNVGRMFLHMKCAFSNESIPEQRLKAFTQYSILKKWMETLNKCCKLNRMTE